MDDYREYRSKLAEHFEGKWETVLSTLVSDERLPMLFTKKRNVRCPACDRAKKFYMRNTDTARSLCCHPDCNFCAYDGISLAKALGGFSNEIDVCKILEHNYANELTDPIFKKGKARNKPPLKAVYRKPSSIKPREDKPKKLNKKAQTVHKRILNEIIDFDDEKAALAHSYIKSRGLNLDTLMDNIKGNLFFHPNLFYYHTDDNEEGEEVITKGFYPAIIAKIFGFDGVLIGFHRIYLDAKTGEKANLPEAKKLVSPLYEDEYSNKGSVVPLANASEVIGICEGIETALAINQMGHPCWSLIDAYKFPKFQPPQGVKVVNAFGDLDRSETGQNALIKLYQHLKETRPEIKVNLYLPPNELWNKELNPKGIDFLDIFLEGYVLPEELQIS